MIVYPRKCSLILVVDPTVRWLVNKLATMGPLRRFDNAKNTMTALASGR